MSSCFFFFFLKHPFGVWIRFSYGYGWLGLHIWWRMIRCCLIFWSTIYLMPYWAIFPFQLRFIDLHGFAWSSPSMRYISSWWFVFILSWFPNGGFLESFSQAHIIWYCRDSLMELFQAHSFPCHHLCGAHVRLNIILYS